VSKYQIESVLVVVALSIASGCRRQPATPPPAATTVSSSTAREPKLRLPRANHGTGAIEGEQPEFDRGLQPERIMAALAIRPGQNVADLGAGRGYFIPRLAAAVAPGGRVVATDIDDTALETLRVRFGQVANVVVRQAAADDPGLEPGQYDLVLMSEMDHFLADRVDYLKRVRAALKPNGIVAVTHFTGMQVPLMQAASTAGYRIVRELQTPQHYLVLLEPIASN
jgi:2-polyprenyl-3-methyl-5-hydroxy-6-metoxy-1,4-benzoquinol methylase